MALHVWATAYGASGVPVKEHHMFGFWFWILTPVALVLVVAFVYDRRHNGARVDPAEVRNNEPRHYPEPPPGGGAFPGV